MALASYFVFFFLSHQLLLSFCEEHDPNPICPPFRCGQLGYIGFPFSNRTHPKCGLFVVDNCTQPHGPTIQLVKNEPLFYVRYISPDNKLKLSEQVYDPHHTNRTCASFINMTLPHSSLISFDAPYKSNLFKCPHSYDKTTSNISYLCNSTNYSIFHYDKDSNVPSTPPIGCSVIRRPVTKTQKRVEFLNLYAGSFLIKVNVSRECYECHWREGQCESDIKGKFHCSNEKTGRATKGRLMIILIADEEIGFNPRCPSFHCGRLGNIGFPFSNRTHSECGLCIVDNCNKEVQKIQLGKDGPWFNITGMSHENWIKAVDQPLNLIKNLNNHSCKSFKNLTLLSSPFLSFEIPFRQNYFKCPQIRDSIPTNSRLLCNDSSHSIIYPAAVDLPSLPPQCSNFQLQVNKNRKSVHLLNAYTGFFTLKLNVTRECYECHWKEGQCQSDSVGNFYCSTARTGKLFGLFNAFTELLGLKITVARYLQNHLFFTVSKFLLIIWLLLLLDFGED